MADKKWPVEIPSPTPRRRNPLCHRMSGFLFKPPPSIVTPGEQAMLNTFECQGTGCALFVQQADPQGRPSGTGVCGDLMQAISLAQIAATLQEMRALMEADDESEDPAPNQPGGEG